MSGANNWQDLVPRVLSGVAMAASGLVVVWAGGWIFVGAVCGLAALMGWEAARLFGAKRPVAVAAIAGTSVLAAVILSGTGLAGVPVILLGVGFCVWVSSPQPRFMGVALFAVILMACYFFLLLRIHAGMAWVFWLVCVVVASDVAGYFAGRAFGGPKFWPAISPKKTWSGTIAGWVGAALVGAAFAGVTGAGMALVPVSVLVGLSGQMGDIFESAVKRRVGVKDSSNLIPGHGGVLDRLDALLGAVLVAAPIWMGCLQSLAP